jgi:carbamate kinase
LIRVADVRERLARSVFAPGSKGPKLESAIEFVQATRGPTVITTLGAIAAAMRGEAGTTVRP